MEKELVIQTLTKEKKWEDCEHKSWSELIHDGWVFQYLNYKGNIVMIRNGYLNEFRNKL